MLAFERPGIGDEEEKKYEYYSGTASLIKEVSKHCYIMKTAASNFVRIDRDEEGEVTSHREHLDAYMFLQRKGFATNATKN